MLRGYWSVVLIGSMWHALIGGMCILIRGMLFVTAHALHGLESVRRRPARQDQMPPPLLGLSGCGERQGSPRAAAAASLCASPAERPTA